MKKDFYTLNRKKISLPLWAGCMGLFLFLSCEKTITVDIPDAEIKVVVEGYIEPGKVAQVLLTKSSSYFGKVPTTEEELLEMIIMDATVIVSSGTLIDTLSLVYDTTAGFFPPLFYQGHSNTLIGEAGKSYDLKIITDSETVTATTSIPNLIPLDSVWFEVQSVEHPNRGFGWGVLTDPDTLGNCYRIMAKRLGKDSKFVAPYGSPFDDTFINGKSFEFYFSRGLEAGEHVDEHDDDIYYFMVGDTVVVRFCTIDKAHLDFWLTAENDIYNQGNPFATPTTLVTNINGGLGVWGGYGAAYDTIICK
jgi:hypothetical protein